MTEYVSAVSRLAFGREDTAQPYGTKSAAFGGTGGSTTPRFLGITNQAIDLPDKQLDVRQYRSFGHGRKYFLNKAGRRERSGSIPFLPTTAELFYYAFGTDAFTSGTPNEHVLTPANAATLPSMSLGAALEGTPDFLRVFTGVTVEALNLSLSESGELSASMDVVAKDVEDEQTASPSLFTQPTGAGQTPYMFYDRAADVTLMGTYNFSTNSMTGGRTIARVKSFSCSIRNNLKPMYFSQSSNAQDPFVYLTSYPDFELSMEIVPAGKLSGDTDALYDLLEGETQGDILIPFQRSASDTLSFVFEDAILRAAPHSMPDDGGEITVSVNPAVEELRVFAKDSISQYSTL